jgi:hypothetical protein
MDKEVPMASRKVDIVNRKVGFIRRAFEQEYAAGLIVVDDWWWAFSPTRVLRIAPKTQALSDYGPYNIIPRASRMISAMTRENESNGGWGVFRGEIVKRGSKADKKNPNGSFMTRTEQWIRGVEADLAKDPRWLKRTPLLLIGDYPEKDTHVMFCDPGDSSRPEAFFSTDECTVKMMDANYTRFFLSKMREYGTMWLIGGAAEDKSGDYRLDGFGTETRLYHGRMYDYMGMTLRTEDAGRNAEEGDAISD